MNIIGFNISWFGLVFLGNSFIPIAALFLCFHFYFEIKNKREFLYLLIVCSIGILLDSLLQYLNFFVFQEADHIPFWLMILWACFATTLCHSFKFIGSSLWLQFAAGFVAPFSYFAGSKFSAVQFSNSLLFTYGVLTTLWILFFVVFFKLKSIYVDKENSHV